MASLNVMTLPGKRMSITVFLMISLSATIFLLRSNHASSLDIVKPIPIHIANVIRGQTSLSPVDIAIGGAFAPVRLDMYSLLGKTEKENNGKKVSAGPHRRSV
jgi:hypothetical protein